MKRTTESDLQPSVHGLNFWARHPPALKAGLLSVVGFADLKSKLFESRQREIMNSIKGSSFSPFRSVLALLFLLSTCSSVFTPLTSAATPAHFQHAAPTEGRPTEIPKLYKLSRQDEVFIEDLQRRSFQYFWEQADPHTGLVPDRARMDRAPLAESHHNVASIAATGFSLTALCIAAERNWITSQQARERTRNTLRFFADKAFQTTRLVLSLAGREDGRAKME